MKIIDHIKNANGKTLFSFEILPPLKGAGINSLWAGIDPLIEFNPSFIDVTYHREDYVLKKRADGTMDKVSTKKRPGTVAICAALQHKYKIDAVPHLICGGFTKEDTENALIDLHFLGIDNILALRGDARKGDDGFLADPNGNQNALDLIYQIKNMNSGVYLDEALINANVTGFCVGSAAYPEKHIDAISLESDMKFLKRKVSAGAEFLITQMFFDNSAYINFVKLCTEMEITLPIIPGIKPLSTKKQIEILPKLFHIQLPEELTKAILACKDDDAVKQVGIEWAITQCKELIKHKVPVLHFYTMGKSEQTKAICNAIY
jgi:methylenetetrahydrofolate reductase (NADPH)